MSGEGDAEEDDEEEEEDDESSTAVSNQGSVLINCFQSMVDTLSKQVSRKLSLIENKKLP